MSKTTLGVIVGNRGFFPDHLCQTGRLEVLRVLEEEGIGAIALSPEDTPFGSIETLEDAKKCAALFKEHADQIDGILVTLPNFGDERAIATAIRMSGLNVPVLVQAFPDEVGKMGLSDRRDSFCGKMSACNNLWQYDIPYSLTTLHTVAPDSEGFRQDLGQFAATCRVVRGLQGARFGMLGARPAAFITVRFSEKLLEQAGITVDVLDLSDAFGRVGLLSDNDPDVQANLQAITSYVPTAGTPTEALLKMAKFPGHRALDGRKRPGRLRRPVLDLHGRVLWHRALCCDEHDEQCPQAQRLRDRHHRRYWHVRHGAGLAQAERAD